MSELKPCPFQKPGDVHPLKTVGVCQPEFFYVLCEHKSCRAEGPTASTREKAPPVDASCSVKTVKLNAPARR